MGMNKLVTLFHAFFRMYNASPIFYQNSMGYVINIMLALYYPEHCLVTIVDWIILQSPGQFLKFLIMGICSMTVLAGKHDSHSPA